MSSTTPAITITENARQRLLDAGLQEGGYLRIKVISGGCSGHTFDATIEAEMSDGDVIVLDHDNLRIITDPKSSLFINGLDIDYSNDLIQAGFLLTNGNASESCGCGASFAM